MLTRHADDIVEPLAQAVENDNGVFVVLFHELIRKMPGTTLRKAVGP